MLYRCRLELRILCCLIVWLYAISRSKLGTFFKCAYKKYNVWTQCPNTCELWNLVTSFLSFSLFTSCRERNAFVNMNIEIHATFFLSVLMLYRYYCLNERRYSPSTVWPYKVFSFLSLFLPAWASASFMLYRQATAFNSGGKGYMLHCMHVFAFSFFHFLPAETLHIDAGAIPQARVMEAELSMRTYNMMFIHSRRSALVCELMYALI